jgi:hypothetical protein
MPCASIARLWLQRYAAQGVRGSRLAFTWPPIPAAPCCCCCHHTGERVPCDGEVLEGVAALDESMLTGESVLVAKRPGAAVAGGTVVYEGPLTIRATATGAESTLAGGAAVLCFCAAMVKAIGTGLPCLCFCQ